MPCFIPGLQQVTAISAPPQKNLDFCVGEFGQRLVKRTDNLDNPAVYHLYVNERARSADAHRPLGISAASLPILQNTE